MKIFNIKINISTRRDAFAGASVASITREEIERANERLMGVVEPAPAMGDVYVRNNISRPSMREIEEAGSRALRLLSSAN